MRHLKFDVMLDDRFVCTLRMPYLSIFVVTQKEIKKYVEKKRPSLKGKRYTIAL